ncbi:predicted protein [Nematostella vectensis]|uniref:Myb-like domain-containing protein n=1 Tax=Nematostella vectensis TaxID=45351 RepID=A7RYD0_NEMVE|nr:uncharacterized protein LOC5515376 [Nematostella vectensis]EDO43498.1 predicted protein [Nematostella vectensis]|eukprot:XP_001635561.1 predicted protein [Nematostella vectensis]
MEEKGTENVPEKDSKSKKTIPNIEGGEQIQTGNGGGNIESSVSRPKELKTKRCRASVKWNRVKRVQVSDVFDSCEPQAKLPKTNKQNRDIEKTHECVEKEKFIDISSKSCDDTGTIRNNESGVNDESLVTDQSKATANKSTQMVKGLNVPTSMVNEGEAKQDQRNDNSDAVQGSQASNKKFENVNATLSHWQASCKTKENSQTGNGADHFEKPADNTNTGRMSSDVSWESVVGSSTHQEGANSSIENTGLIDNNTEASSIDSSSVSTVNAVQQEQGREEGSQQMSCNTDDCVSSSQANRKGRKRKQNSETNKSLSTSEKTNSLDWTQKEKQLLLNGLKSEPGEIKWKKLARMIKTKNLAQIKSYTESFSARDSSAMVPSDTPLDTWLKICNDASSDLDDVDAKCLPQLLTIAAFEPVAQTSVPGPNYPQIYNFLSAVLRGDVSQQLAPLDAKVVLELLTNLESRLMHSDYDKQIKFLRDKHDSVLEERLRNTAIRHLEEIISTEEQERLIKECKKTGYPSYPERKSSRGRKLKTKIVGLIESVSDESDTAPETLNPKKSSSLNPVGVPVNLLNITPRLPRNVTTTLSMRSPLYNQTRLVDELKSEKERKRREKNQKRQQQRKEKQKQQKEQQQLHKQQNDQQQTKQQQEQKQQ